MIFAVPLYILPYIRYETEPTLATFDMPGLYQFWQYLDYPILATQFWPSQNLPISATPYRSNQFWHMQILGSKILNYGANLGSYFLVFICSAT